METLQEVFDNCTANGFIIRPPAQQLPDKLYANFKKHMTQNLGKWKTNKQHFEFQFDAEILLDKLRKGERPNFKQDWHYFPTPKAVIEFMGNIHIPMNCTILEPSAGQGAIVEGINDFISANNEWIIIEANPLNRKVLEEKGLTVDHDDFETYEPTRLADIVFANPPFKRDVQHVQKMTECIRKHGSIVVVLPSNFPEKYKKQMAEWEEMFEYVQVFDLPEGAFKESKTGVSTCIIHFYGKTC